MSSKSIYVVPKMFFKQVDWQHAWNIYRDLAYQIEICLIKVQQFKILIGLGEQTNLQNNHHKQQSKAKLDAKFGIPIF